MTRRQPSAAAETSAGAPAPGRSRSATYAHPTTVSPPIVRPVARAILATFTPGARRPSLEGYGRHTWRPSPRSPSVLWPFQNLSGWPLSVALRHAAAAPNCAAARGRRLGPPIGGSPGTTRSTIATRTASPANPGRAGRGTDRRCRCETAERDRHAAWSPRSSRPTASTSAHRRALRE